VHQFIVAHGGEALHLAHDRAHVTHSLDDVAGTGLTFGANHGRAFGYAPQCFAQIACTTHEWDAEMCRRSSGRGQARFVIINNPGKFSYEGAEFQKGFREEK